MPSVGKNRQINILHLYSSATEFVLEILAAKEESTDVDSYDHEMEIKVDVHQKLKKSVVFTANLTENLNFFLDFPRCEGEMFSRSESFSCSSMVDR